MTQADLKEHVMETFKVSFKMLDKRLCAGLTIEALEEGNLFTGLFLFFRFSVEELKRRMAM